jgi:hypothetical protein
MENEKRIPSASEWLRKHRNKGCPQHGFHIAKSLVRYSGYCRHCDRFWRYFCHNDMATMPYFWYYYDPETQVAIGRAFSGRHNGKSRNSKNKAHRHRNSGISQTFQNNVDRSKTTDRKENSVNTDTVGNNRAETNDDKGE